MRNTKKGFTLVELLVVIAILAILATVSVVGYTNYINNANNSKAQQELTQLRDYAMAYDLSHDGTGAKDGKVNATEAQQAIDDCDIEGVALVGNNVTYTVNGKVIAYWDITTGTITLGAPAAGGETPVDPDPETPVTPAYVKVTNADDFTTGQYVLVAGNGYAPDCLDGTWISAVQPTVEGNNVTDTKDAVWTITVNGSNANLVDKNGVSVAPKSGTDNGIKSGNYDWVWSFNDGTITFSGYDGAMILASNATSGANQYDMRAYKSSTVTGQYSANYYSTFTVYKFVTE